MPSPTDREEKPDYLPGKDSSVIVSYAAYSLNPGNSPALYQDYPVAEGGLLYTNVGIPIPGDL
ncbi:MAG: hypothetical protein JSU77_13795 [Fidelibacterota bacterium]|nr:MAG: hypothetical protein JSU77_13795 [Candidatus Neomarinimicrobiota bacterium]